MTATATVSDPRFSSFLSDWTAAYGAFAPGQLSDCLGSTGDCYLLTNLRQTRPPSVHWDIALDETPSTGHPRRWPVHVGETFPDVPRSDTFYRFVETLVHHGVTAGCGYPDYCPATAATREQMAVFVLVAREGPF